MIIPFSNSISPMETSLPVCPFRQGRFPFAGVNGRCLEILLPNRRRSGFSPGFCAAGEPEGGHGPPRMLCLPCVRGGGTALCAVTEGLQIPAAVQECAYPSLSQPDGCQLPLHKGAKGRGTDVPEKTITPPQTKQPSQQSGRAAAFSAFIRARAHIHFCARARERLAQSRSNAGALPAPTVSPPP